MTVYVVVLADGEYSDYHVTAVCSTRDQAKAVADLGNGGEVLPFELDEIADRLLQGYRDWIVEFDRDGKPTPSEGYDPLRLWERPLVRPMGKWVAGPRWDKDWGWIVKHVVARGAVEAIKIAADLRAQFLAQSEMAP